MKKVLLIVLVGLLTFASADALSFDEKNLPHEQKEGAKNLRLEMLLESDEAIQFVGYVGSKDVTMVGDVMGIVYHLCRTAPEELCSDDYAVLLVGAADGNEVGKMLKQMDDIIESGAKIKLILTKKPYLYGAKRLLKIGILN